MSWTRRQVLGLAGGLGAGALLACSRRRGRSSSSPEPRSVRVGGPRYVILVYLGGGIDAVLSADPRTRSEVAAGVDVPYAPGDIVEAGGLRLGPALAPLARWAPGMAILKGVQVHTANHYSGAQQMHKLKTGVAGARVPGALDIIGRYRDEQPLACITLGPATRHQYSSSWLAQDVLEELDRIPRDELPMVAASLRAEAARLRRRGGGSDARGATHLIDTARLVDIVGATPPFEPSWPGGREVAVALERALWAMERDVSRCVYLVASHLAWDTHTHNLARQTRLAESVFPLIDRFLAEARTRRNAHGALADNMLVVITSELGRFPKLNGNRGKDHFPEIAMMLWGAGVRGNAVYGATGTHMESLPISFRTGAADSAGARPSLDDVGATLLQACGVDSRPYGYRGRSLSCLFEGIG